jgi:hypothetical protein
VQQIQLVKRFSVEMPPPQGVVDNAVIWLARHDGEYIYEPNMLRNSTISRVSMRKSIPSITDKKTGNSRVGKFSTVKSLPAERRVWQEALARVADHIQQTLMTESDPNHCLNQICSRIPTDLRTRN